jgi:hypothetical protein
MNSATPKNKYDFIDKELKQAYMNIEANDTHRNRNYSISESTDKNVHA